MNGDDADCCVRGGMNGRAARRFPRELFQARVWAGYWLIFGALIMDVRCQGLSIIWLRSVRA